MTTSAAALQMHRAESPREPSPPGKRALRPISDEVRELERACGSSKHCARRRACRTKQPALIKMPLRTFVTKLERYGITAAEWDEPNGPR